ncbi:MAG: glycosyltransferase family 4 protein [Planctomycetota bacterium]
MSGEADGPVTPMRLAVVIESFNPAAGGNERSTQQIIQELVERGQDVTLITGCCDAENEPAGVSVRVMSREKSSSVFRLMRFAKWAKAQLREGRFDASLSVTMAVPASVVQPRGGTVRETLARNVVMKQGGWAGLWKKIEVQLDAKQRLLLKLEKQTLTDPSVFRVAAISRYVVEQLERHYAFPASRTAVIPNAAVMPAVDDVQQSAWRDEVRAEFNVPDEAVLYLLAAQNPRLKGYPTLLGALNILREQGVPAVALLIGGFGDRELRSAKAAEVEHMVRFVGPTREMPRMFAAADVTVLPSWYDPSSKVVLESLMTGTPAISTTFNGASDHLTPPEGPPRGVVIDDPGDPRKLADAMAKLADPGFRAACSAACGGLAGQLSMARHVDRLEAVLAEAARAASAG